MGRRKGDRERRGPEAVAAGCSVSIWTVGRYPRRYR
jgi:hypothetical protein